MELKSEDYLRVCARGDLELVNEVFKDLNREEIESIRDDHKASCLHYAARAGLINVLDYLINQKNVSPFLVSEIGAACIHDAAVKGKLDVIKWLLKNTNLSTSFKDANGATIIHLASKFDQTEIIEWLLEIEGVKSAKILTFNGATCLHFAASSNAFKSLRILIKAVPSYVNYQMINGATPVYLAVQENNITMMKYLVKCGANLNVRAEDGMNSIHVACQNGNLEMCQILIDDYNMNINEKDYNGATPLHYACINGKEKLVAFLLSHGAKILIDKFGNSPLHDSAVSGNIPCARLLIASNCDILQKDNDNMTCCDIAESYGHIEYAKEIRKFEKAALLKKYQEENVNQEDAEKLINTMNDKQNDLNSNSSTTKNVNNPTPSLANRVMRKSPSSNSILNPTDKDSVCDPYDNLDNFDKLDPKMKSEKIKKINEIINSSAKTSGANKQIHDSIISPLSNSIAVVSTSTPSNETINSSNNSTPSNTNNENSSQTISNTNSSKFNNANNVNSQSANLTYVIKPNVSKSKLVQQDDEFDDNNNLNQNYSKNYNYNQTQTANETRYEKSSSTKNQCFIRIIRNDDTYPKHSLNIIENDETRVSALEELDKCIAEFETNDEQNVFKQALKNQNSRQTNLSNKLTKTNNDTFSSEIKDDQNNSSSFTKISVLEQLSTPNNNNNKSNTSTTPDSNNNTRITYSNVSSNQMPNEIIKNITPATTIAPPAPPMPSNFLSQNRNSTGALNLLRFEPNGKENEKINRVKSCNLLMNADKCIKPESRSTVNYIDELQNHFKAGTLLKKKNENTLEEKRPDSYELKIDIEGPKKLKFNEHNLVDDILPNVKKTIELRTSQKDQTTIPEWKRLLIEKKKNRLNSNQ